MKVAIPVKDDSLTFFGNAGHTPYFAVYAVKGAGMFKASNDIHTTQNVVSHLKSCAKTPAPTSTMSMRTGTSTVRTATMTKRTSKSITTWPK